MVVYATLLRDISVIDLFAGGIIPGLLMALALLGVSFFSLEAQLPETGADAV